MVPMFDVLVSVPIESDIGDKNLEHHHADRAVCVEVAVREKVSVLRSLELASSRFVFDQRRGGLRVRRRSRLRRLRVGRLRAAARLRRRTQPAPRLAIRKDAASADTRSLSATAIAP
jgi:hypothetical protein